MEGHKLSSAKILSRIREEGPCKTPERIELPAEDPDPPLSPLLQAAFDGDLSLLVSLLREGAAIDLLDHNGKTALCHALFRRHTEIAHHLVDSGADVNCVLAETPPLLSAIGANDCVLVEKMLDRGADIHLQSRDYGWTALMSAGTEEMIALLASRGASFHARNKIGHDAIEECRFQAEAIRRREADRKDHYVKLGEMSSYDPVLREKLLRGLEEGSQEHRAKKYDELAAILDRYRT